MRRGVVSVFEMAYAGFHHCHTLLIAIVDAFLIANRTAGLDDGIHAGLMSYLDAVAEGEECIGSHDSAIEVESERLCFGDGLLEGIDT